MSTKQKTKKSAIRRFKVTGTGKITRRVAFGRHLHRKKSASQSRRYKQTIEVTGKIGRRLKRLMALA